jgi:hypothetical protein
MQLRISPQDGDMKTLTALVVAGGATAGATLLAFGPLHQAWAQPATASRAVLVESPSCSNSTFSSPVSMSTGLNVPQVAVQVPATVLLKLDAAGHVVEAATNSGCAPRLTDDVYLIEPDGTVHSGDANVLVGHQWVGDFTGAGVYQPQPV